MMGNNETVVYKRRWYILGLFCVWTMEQCAVVVCFGPFAASAKQVFSWENWTIALFTDWGMIGFLLAAVPSAWLLARSLRHSMLLGGMLVGVGAAIRCLPLVWSDIPDTAFQVACHVGGFINALSGPIAMSAPLQVSASWFPPNERLKATSLGQMFNALGVGLSFVLGTIVVHGDDVSTCSNCTILTNHTNINIIQKREDIFHLMYIHGAASLAIMGLIFLYFPSQPPSPPSNSANQPRLEFLSGCSTLLRSRNGWFLMITYAVAQGLIQMWQAMMVVNLTDLNIDGVTEQWVLTLGIVLSFVSVGITVIVATFMDCFKRRLKVTIIVLLSIAGIAFIFCTLLMEQVLVFQDPANFKLAMYILLLIGTSLGVASAPISFELSVETCYPIPEGVIGTWLTVWFNVVAFIFFGIFFLPEVGVELSTSWLSYVLPVSVILPLPAILGVKETYNRLKVDNQSS